MSDCLYYLSTRFDTVLTSSGPSDWRLGRQGVVELQEAGTERRFVVRINELVPLTEMEVLARFAA